MSKLININAPYSRCVLPPSQGPFRESSLKTNYPNHGRTTHADSVKPSNIFKNKN
jgi:hypothetical protein